MLVVVGLWFVFVALRAVVDLAHQVLVTIVVVVVVFIAVRVARGRRP